jgi:5-methylcytosine-specific restriction enzyme A
VSGWATSNRKAELPRDWHKIRQQVKRRACGRCQAATHVPDCDGIGTDCDHVGDPHDHSPDNLQWLSRPCHQAKTAADKPQRKRPAPAHPGVIA